MSNPQPPTGESTPTSAEHDSRAFNAVVTSEPGPNEPEFDVERTFVCPTCQDKGFVLYQRACRFGYSAWHGRPCTECEYGITIIEARAKKREERKAKGRGPNRRRTPSFEHIGEV